MLRIVSINVWEGGGDRVGAITSVLRRMRADAIGLVEADSRASVEALGRALQI
jgi:hypothetical protein